MCGILYINTVKNKNITENYFKQLLMENSKRGKDSCGMYIIKDNKILHTLIYEYIDNIFDSLNEMYLLFNKYKDDNVEFFIHFRAKPLSENMGKCTQPLYHNKSNTLTIFNGIIQNDKDFIEDNIIDTYSIPVWWRSNIKELKGNATIIIKDLNDNTTNLIVNKQPCYVNDDYSIISSINIGNMKLIHKTSMVIYPDIISNINKYINTDTKYNVNTKHAIVLCSGGLDSAACLKYATEHNDKVYALFFNYKQKAVKQEYNAAKLLCDKLNCELININISLFDVDNLGSVVGEESLESLKRWIPARNMLFLSYALHVAESLGCANIYYGANLEEAGVYPDNTISAIDSVNKTIPWFISSNNTIKILAPFKNYMKKDILNELDNDLIKLTWSCDFNGNKECGICEGCLLKYNNL